MSTSQNDFCLFILRILIYLSLLGREARETAFIIPECSLNSGIMEI